MPREKFVHYLTLIHRKLETLTQHPRCFTVISSFNSYSKLLGSCERVTQE